MWKNGMNGIENESTEKRSFKQTGLNN